MNEANAAARMQPVRNGFINAIQVYPFVDGALYQAYTAPGQITDIALQPGETLVGSGPIAAGAEVNKFLLHQPLNLQSATFVIEKAERSITVADASAYWTGLTFTVVDQLAPEQASATS